MNPLLGVDYGDKHIGLAVAVAPLAEPVVTIELEKAGSRISELVEEYQISTIVVGVSEGKMAERSKQFGENLAAEFKIEVVFHDETLTSQDARKMAAKSGKKKSVREAKIDHYAAAIMLQDYIDSI